jgi:hypothetical protein
MLRKFTNIDTVKILEDGVVIDPYWADGRPIPSVIVDASKRKDISEYVEAHRNQPPGDVIVQWGTSFPKKKKVSLIIKSSRPVHTEFAISFDVEKNHALIDGIIQSNGLYLQTGIAGERVSQKLSEGRVLIEVPKTGFEEIWEKILIDFTRKYFRQRGLSREQSKTATKDHVKSMREFWALRRNT